MRRNRLHELARHKRPALNGWLSCDSGYLAEVLGHCGFDAVTVDLQHGQYGLDAAPHLLQAISATQAMPLVRCSQNDFAEINKLLDAGAYGVICPMIEDRDGAERFVRACRYPPRGGRSFGPARGLLYGGSDYFEHANTTVMALAMIETPRALENLDEILAVDGLDGVYIGPNDLAVNLGIGPGGDWDAPELGEAIRHIVARCRARGRYVGIFCGDVAMATAMRELGVDMLTPGNDVQLVRAEASRRLSQLRG